jgi:hypothetical protein
MVEQQPAFLGKHSCRIRGTRAFMDVINWNTNKTHSKEESPSSEACGYTAGQEIHCSIYVINTVDVTIPYYKNNIGFYNCYVFQPQRDIIRWENTKIQRSMVVITITIYVFKDISSVQLLLPQFMLL